MRLSVTRASLSGGPQPLLRNKFCLETFSIAKNTSPHPKQVPPRNDKHYQRQPHAEMHMRPERSPLNMLQYRTNKSPQEGEGGLQARASRAFPAHHAVITDSAGKKTRRLDTRPSMLPAAASQKSQH